MSFSKFVYIDTRPGFGLFSQPNKDVTGEAYSQWLDEQFSKSSSLGSSFLWGLSQKINELQYLLSKEKIIITVLGTPEEANIALMFLHNKLSSFTDSITLLSESLND